MLKENKGVTLVALIITIIVLLILAGVVISMTLGNEGIIKKSQNAVDKYEHAAGQEQNTMDDFENKLDSLIYKVNQPTPTKAPTPTV